VSARVSPQVPRNSSSTLASANPCAIPEIVAKCCIWGGVSCAMLTGWIAIVTIPPTEPSTSAQAALRLSVMRVL